MTKIIWIAMFAIGLTACAGSSNTETESNQTDVEVVKPVSPTATVSVPDTTGVSIEEQVLNDANVAVPSPARSEHRQDAAPEADFARQSRASGLALEHKVAPSVALGVAPASYPEQNRENYLEVEQNGIQRTTDSPFSTFSIDVDTAAYSNLRRMIMAEGRLPPKDAVRLEEMINYFNYQYATPEDLDNPLAVTTEVMAAPWNTNNTLLMVGIKGFEPQLAQRPAANLVFLVDVSGSMQAPNKLGLVQRSLNLLVDQMGELDRIALVVYAGVAGTVLDSTSGKEKAKIKNAINSLTAGGSTHGSAGIQLAYQIAEANKIDNGINRVIIASDGDMNVGITGIDDLKELIEKKRNNGIALTTLGYGTGNYNYSLMEQLADVGNGNAAYIDSLSEARKVLVEEMQSTLLTIAKDVKIQIEFNPNVVAEYRLLGYENRALADEDFTNDKVDAGEVGAGHTVTALYELTMVGAESQKLPNSRYQQSSAEQNGIAKNTIDFSNEIGFLKIRYKQPNANASVEMSQPLIAENQRLSNNIKFAAAVAGFGELLRGSKYTESWNYDAVITLANSAKDKDDGGYRGEFVNMVKLAKLL